jgi:hypothetical protein
MKAGGGFMKSIILLVSLIISTYVFADRINYSSNSQARNQILSLDIVKDQFSKIASLSNNKVELVWVTSTEVGIRSDLGLNDEFNSGMKHKFLFTSEDESIDCRFSLYVIYQHTAPLSLNKKFTEITSDANCN